MSFSFGSSTAPSTGAASFGFGGGGGGFGGTSSTTSTVPAASFGFGTGAGTGASSTTATFGFGGTTGGTGTTTGTGTGGGGLFGFPSTDSSTHTGFQFGSTPAAGTTSTSSTGAGAGGGLFGGGGSSTGFGFGTQPATTTGTGTSLSLFGQPATTSTTAFGGALAPATTSLFPASTTTAGVAASGSASAADNPDRRLLALRLAYDPRSPSCRFQTMFYNRVDPRVISRYQRPEHVPLKLWQQAIKNNPDPNNLVPTHAVGFKDLKARIQEQDKAAASAQSTLDDISRTIDEMQHAHQATTRSVIQQLKQAQQILCHRLLCVMSGVELARARDLPLLMDEIDFRRKLESLQRKLPKPQGRVSELSSIVRMCEDRPADAGPASGPVLDRDTIQNITQLLCTQGAALDHLTRVLQTDRHDLEAIIKGEGDGDTPRHSHSTNRDIHRGMGD